MSGQATEEENDVDDHLEHVVEDHDGLRHEGELVGNEDAHIEEEH